MNLAFDVVVLYLTEKDTAPLILPEWHKPISKQIGNINQIYKSAYISDINTSMKTLMACKQKNWYLTLISAVPNACPKGATYNLIQKTW